MSLIKEHLHRRDEEEQELYLALMEFLDESEELFSQLSQKEISEEVMGYE